MSNFKDYLVSDEEYEILSKEANAFEQKEMKGTYALKTIESKACDAKFGDGINLKLLVKEGELQGYQFFHTIYLTGENEIGVRIAKHNFNSLTRLKGFFNKPEDLINIDFLAYVSTWKNPETGKLRYNLSIKKDAVQKQASVMTAPIIVAPEIDEDIPF
jgi:hypothetical protein